MGNWWTGEPRPCKVTGDAHHALAEVVDLVTGPHWEHRCTLCRQVWWTRADNEQPKACLRKNCSCPVLAKGLCRQHYDQWRFAMKKKRNIGSWTG